MAFTISALSNSISNFTVVDSNGNESVSIVDSINSFNNYTYEASGSGIGAINNIASLSGTLNSGISTQIDLHSFDQSTIKGSQSIAFTGVKSFSVYNTSTIQGYDFEIQATGTHACTNLFNGGSGNLIIKPYASFQYNDRFTGFPVTSTNRYLYLNDLGSGVSYKIFVFGIE
jgi:hypothetical protein